MSFVLVQGRKEIAITKVWGIENFVETCLSFLELCALFSFAKIPVVMSCDYVGVGRKSGVPGGGSTGRRVGEKGLVAGGEWEKGGSGGGREGVKGGVTDVSIRSMQQDNTEHRDCIAETKGCAARDK